MFCETCQVSTHQNVSIKFYCAFNAIVKDCGNIYIVFNSVLGELGITKKAPWITGYFDFVAARSKVVFYDSIILDERWNGYHCLIVFT